MKYTKKPIPVEAVRFNGENREEIENFVGEKAVFKSGELFIYTLEGIMKSVAGDYIIKGIHGEFYPCKEDIFMESYEEYEENDADKLFSNVFG